MCAIGGSGATWLHFVDLFCWCFNVMRNCIMCFRSLSVSKYYGKHLVLCIKVMCKRKVISSLLYLCQNWQVVLVCKKSDKKLFYNIKFTISERSRNLVPFLFVFISTNHSVLPIHQQTANKEVYSRIYVKLLTLFITYIYNVINHRQSRVLQLGPSYLSAILNNVWLRRRYVVNARKTWLPFEIT